MEKLPPTTLRPRPSAAEKVPVVKLTEAKIFLECLDEHPVKYAPNCEKTPKHSLIFAPNKSADVTDNGVVSDWVMVD